MTAVYSKFGPILLAFQILFLILFATITKYDPQADASKSHQKFDPHKNDSQHHEVEQGEGSQLPNYYPMFQDVHVMIFVGFGFLMTYLKRYGFSSVGINFVVAAFVLQWAILFHAMMHGSHGRLPINIVTLLTADFAAAAVLISFGALLGKTSPLQMIVMAFFEIMIFAGNEKLGLSAFKAVDVGGSMFVHVFGAYFGLAVSRVLKNKEVEKSTNEGSVYHSDIFAMIGTLFLWLYWPSFNSGVAASGDAQHRAVINTYLALAGSCVTSYGVSSIVGHRGRFDMVHIQNATLAGGVAVGTCADMMIQPWGALLIGCLAGLLSTIGYKFVTPAMTSYLEIHDSCGVNNLHGMPGLLAGICGIFAALAANEETYGYSLYTMFPARAPPANSSSLRRINEAWGPGLEPGQGRSAGVQALYQSVALVVTFFMACAGGVVTGLILRLSVFSGPQTGSQMFTDVTWWEVPDDFDDVTPDVEVSNEETETKMKKATKYAQLLENVQHVESDAKSEYYC